MWFFVGFILGLGTAYKFVVEPIKIKAAAEVAALEARLIFCGVDKKEFLHESDDQKHHTF